jgi:catechol 2,3-dioxygenase-like lactoylglutathione lyase family enzyme
MFSHVILGVNDLEASKKFYDALLGILGMKPGVHNHNGVVDRYFYRSATGSFGITRPLNGEPATHANGGTTCEDPPGWREGSVGKLYLAYLRDPDGNKLCALHRPPK